MTATITTPLSPPADRSDFVVERSSESLGLNIPQRLGRVMWAPMFAMSVMAFAIAFGLAVWRATLISDGNAGDAETIAALSQFVPAAMFTGFAMVFAAISFAIARILGAFRSGGGDVQTSIGEGVQTLKMPATTKAFMVGMIMSMMVLLVSVGFHIAVGVALADGSTYAAAHIEQWTAWLDAAHRVGVAGYLLAITLGLATIVTVLRFQTVRIRELAGTGYTA